MAVPQMAMAAVGVVTGVVGMFKASSDKKKAEAEAFRMQQKIQEFENNRQEVINPYAGVESVADMASDLSGEMNNPMANLGVATQAAEIQMEQTDIALANTLDTLMATGASAGGATAFTKWKTASSGARKTWKKNRMKECGNSRKTGSF